jgi:hypothetical protein
MVRATPPHHRPEARLKPPEQRDIVTVRKMPDEPETTLGAVAELLDRDYEFTLFPHARTGEDVVAHRRDDESVGLLHPPGSALSEENEIVVPEPSKYSEPIALAAVRSELDVRNHRFLYFIDAESRRGKVLYLRHDGDDGLGDSTAHPREPRSGCDSSARVTKLAVRSRLGNPMARW